MVINFCEMSSPHTSFRKEDKDLRETNFFTGKFLLHLLIAVLSNFNSEYDCSFYNAFFITELGFELSSEEETSMSKFYSIKKYKVSNQ